MQEEQKELIQEWKHHPQTKAMKRYFQSRLEELSKLENLVQWVGKSSDEVGLRTVELIGKREMIGEVLEYVN